MNIIKQGENRENVKFNLANFLIISFVYGLCFEIFRKLILQFFESTESAVTLCISLLGTICLWNGIMKIAEKTSIIEKLKKDSKANIKIFYFLK